ncbi:hypothetical protein I5I61_21575 [Pseudomonas nitroreducens]|uniref:Uncharacterized protein n=1 Tax=Pseudomonas nitroreducens TaxID=46680 RepID=A0ABS0KPV3_PSENT|nr:hypothetical protein [Pseudomonas nitroreducens]MBG6290054.1 hypothetical protein [Pseudomonas nitroreducens]
MATVNPWRRFIGLLPGGSKTVAEVLGVDNVTGTSRVRLRNGIEVSAIGVSVPEGQNAFISDGTITGPAPDLPQYDIEV